MINQSIIIGYSHQDQSKCHCSAFIVSMLKPSSITLIFFFFFGNPYQTFHLGCDLYAFDIPSSRCFMVFNVIILSLRWFYLLDITHSQVKDGLTMCANQQFSRLGVYSLKTFFSFRYSNMLLILRDFFFLLILLCSYLSITPHK